MKERPIIFNGEMVRVIQEGRKTQTRRIIKPQFAWEVSDLSIRKSDDGLWRAYIHDDPCVTPYWKCPYEVDMTLWVREAWWDLGWMENGKWNGRINGHTCGPKYVATCPDPYEDNETMGIPSLRPRPMPWSATTLIKSTWRKRPPKSMPRWASRTNLLVKNVRAERLQDISEADCLAEGIKRDDIGFNDVWYDYESQRFECPRTPKNSFHSLWDSIYKKRGDGWDVNPWCFVISFEII